LFLSFFGFIIKSKHYLGTYLPRQDHPTKKSSARLYKSVQRARLTVFKMGPWTARKSDTGRIFGRAVRYPSSRRPAHLEPENGPRLKLNEIEEFVNSLRGIYRESQFSGLLLGLSFYSYHVRELLVCWLFFCLLFVLLALVVLGGLLAAYAGNQAIHWASTAVRVAPMVALDSDEIQLDAISGGRKLKRLRSSGS